MTTASYSNKGRGGADDQREESVMHAQASVRSANRKRSDWNTTQRPRGGDVKKEGAECKLARHITPSLSEPRTNRHVDFVSEQAGETADSFLDQGNIVHPGEIRFFSSEQLGYGSNLLG